MLFTRGKAGVKSSRPFLLALPAEIRLQIYRHVFDGTVINVVYQKKIQEQIWSIQPALVLPERGLVMTCRLCQNEALATLWSCATWSFEASAGYYPFSCLVLSATCDNGGHRGLPLLHLIQHLEVFVYHGPTKAQLTLLPNLKTLTFKMPDVVLSQEPVLLGGRSIDVAFLHDEMPRALPLFYDNVPTLAEELPHIHFFKRILFLWLENQTSPDLRKYRLVQFESPSRCISVLHFQAQMN